MPFPFLDELIGGVLIGLAAIVLMVGNGRIAGISGVVGGIVGASKGDGWWRLAFVAGLILGPLLYLRAGYEAPPVVFSAGLVVIAFAGGLVGFGSRLGGGCTSGHGVCGLGRLSIRSLVSVLVFITAAMVTVALGHTL